MNVTQMRQQAIEVVAFADALKAREQELIARADALEAREQELATYAEQLNQSTAVGSAWQQATQRERDRSVMLIDLQLGQLTGAGMNAIVLRALRRMVMEGEG